MSLCWPLRTLFLTLAIWSGIKWATLLFIQITHASIDTFWTISWDDLLLFKFSHTLVAMLNLFTEKLWSTDKRNSVCVLSLPCHSSFHCQMNVVNDGEEISIHWGRSDVSHNSRSRVLGHQYHIPSEKWPKSYPFSEFFCSIHSSLRHRSRQDLLFSRSKMIVVLVLVTIGTFDRGLQYNLFSIATIAFSIASKYLLFSFLREFFSCNYIHLLN